MNVLRWPILLTSLFCVVLINSTSAQTLSNVTDFDASTLAGKQCVGSFRTSENPNIDEFTSLGAVRFTFSVREDVLQVSIDRALGDQAYVAPDTAHFEFKGFARALKIDGPSMTIESALGTEFRIKIDRLKLSGAIYSRIPKPTWVEAEFDMSCP